MEEKVFFEKINGKKIFCYLAEVGSDNKKIVIMSHGFRGSSTGPARIFVDFQRILNKEGYSVLRFDQLNCGNSDGDFLNSSFNEWIDTTTYFAKKYLDMGYKVALLGQSMGGTTTMAATARKELKDKIPCIILWVPDPKSTFSLDPTRIDEEAGQKYKNTFWQEAANSNFFECLGQYKGGIHLVYGEVDRYVHQDLREQVIEKIKAKGHKFMVLKGQDHSPWEFDVVQKVYQEELEFLKNYFK